jgi:hypothetical protein
MAPATVESPRQSSFRMFILNIPRSPDDLHDTNSAFERAGASIAV